LSWTEEKATDQQISDTTRAIVRGFKTGAPQDQTILDLHDSAHGPPLRAWQTGRGSRRQKRRCPPNRPRRRTGNEEEGVEVMRGMYTPLAARLDLAAGDEYHWSSPAYKMISDAIVTKTMEFLNLK